MSFSSRPAKEILRNEDGFFALYAAIVLLLLTAAGYGGLFFLNRAQQATQDQLVDQIRLKEEDLAPRTIDEIYALDRKLKNVGAALSSHVFASSIFPFLQNETHPQVQFMNFSFMRTDRKITMTGVAASYAVLARQISILENDPNVEKLEFGGLTVDDKKKVNFSLTIYVKPALIKTLAGQ